MQIGVLLAEGTSSEGHGVVLDRVDHVEVIIEDAQSDRIANAGVRSELGLEALGEQSIQQRRVVRELADVDERHAAHLNEPEVSAAGKQANDVVLELSDLLGALLTLESHDAATVR